MYRLAKALELFKHLSRAEEHSASLVLQSATKKCDYVQEHIEGLVTGMSKSTVGGRVVVPGGFARHVNNSPKFARKFEKHFRNSELECATTRVCGGRGTSSWCCAVEQIRQLALLYSKI